MKRIFIILQLFAVTVKAEAQGFFNQKGAQTKNLLKQIALLQVYIADLEKGYTIAKQGLATIGNTKDGDFHLHIDHFQALVQINPQIKKLSQVVGIVLLQSDIKQLYKKSGDNYISNVWAHLLQQCADNVTELNTVLSPGNYQMSDDERIRQIDHLYADMQDKYAFARHFASDIKVLSLQQLKEKNEVQVSLLLNNIKTP